MTNRQTQALIDSLTSDLMPTPPYVLLRRLAISLCVGAAVGFVVLIVFYGLRNDLAAALFTWPFWMKGLYTVAFVLVGAMLYERLARPGGSIGKLWRSIAAPALVLSSVALLSISSMPARARAAALWGHSALYCPWNIAFLSMPVLVILLLTLRRAAPTNLRSAGFVAGLLAGGVGASVYVLHCTESSAAFVAAWYTLGILLPALLGAALGPRVLRW